MRFFKHPLLWSAIVIVGLYVVFAHVLNPPLPQSLLIQYMVICAVGILLVVTFDDKTAKTFFRTDHGAVWRAEIVAFADIGVCRCGRGRWVFDL